MLRPKVEEACKRVAGERAGHQFMCGMWRLPSLRRSGRSPPACCDLNHRHAGSARRQPSTTPTNDGLLRVVNTPARPPSRPCTPPRRRARGTCAARARRGRIGPRTPGGTGVAAGRGSAVLVDGWVAGLMDGRLRFTGTQKPHAPWSCLAALLSAIQGRWSRSPAAVVLAALVVPALALPSLG